MANLVLKTERDVADLTLGATFFGVGGGGTAAEGQKLLGRELAAGGELPVVPAGEIPDDIWTVSVSFMGNRAPLTEEQEKQKLRLGLTEWKYENNLVEAVRFLQEVTGKKVGAIVVPELGGANTPAPLSVAAHLGIMAVDADYSGRALPEVAQFGLRFAGYGIAPLASVDKWGNKTVIYETVNESLAERIGKLLATAAFGNTGLAFGLVRGAEMKKSVVPGTVSECHALGRAIREAREAGRNVPEAILAHTGGTKLFTGTVTEKDWSVTDGYYDGYHTLAGEGEFAGHTLKTWFRNETHIAWLDGEPHVTAPDLIGQVRTDDGQPLLNNEVVAGDRLTFIGLPARPMHLRPEALPLLAPRHYGFDIDYLPLRAQ